MHLAPFAADFRESLQAGKRFLFARVGKQKVLGVLRFEAPCVAAKTAKKAYQENISLKEACVQLGFLTAERFDEVFNPENMA